MKTATSMETLLGGADIIITLKNGGTETVRIKQLSIRELPGFLRVQDDELKMAEYLCDKPADWAVTVTDKSVVEIVTEGERINSDFFSQWVQRRLNRQEKLMPGEIRKLSLAAMEKASN